MHQAEWTTPIKQAIQQHKNRGGFICIFPDYRPDLFLALAHSLGLASFDYRHEVMSGYGWDAEQLSLKDLDASIAECAADTATVLGNVEALLSTKHVDACGRWITGFLERDLSHAIVIPIVINEALVPAPHPRVHRVAASALPDQTLIDRLSF